MYFAEKKTWLDAKAACETLAGHLLEVQDQGESDFVATWLDSGGQDSWMGLNDRDSEGDFFWVLDAGSTRAMTFSFWDGDPPDNDNDDCVLFKKGSGDWDDKSCTETREYVCEREPL
jgi:hypothetical protein